MRGERHALVGTMANSIVHDLKNPLHAIRSCAELITLKSPDPVIANFVGIISRAADNMSDMVQEVLDFARGQSSIQLEPAPVSRVIAELETQMAQLIPATIHLIREIDSTTAQVMADTGRFARMLLNLVKNSVEAMPSGGILWLRVRERSGRVIFSVSDTGCGIDTELQAKIYEPFVTFGKSKGTGLGMAIVKSVVEAHGGTITLTSEVNVGTAVDVSLPAVE
jgi:signal transduction histidine kinase